MNTFISPRCIASIVATVPSRWGKAADLAEAVKKRRVGTMINSAGSVALHVAVPADWARSRSLASDVSPQKKKVNDFADYIDAALVLRDTEAPGDDGALGRDVDIGKLANICFGNAGAFDYVRPRGGGDQSAVLLEPLRVILDELAVEHRRIL